MDRKLFILHEIYGVNAFIKDQALIFQEPNTDIDCIALYPNNKIFSYAQEEEAYAYFMNEVGFDAPLETLTKQLMIAIQQYQEVIVIGFSIGATLAWRLSILPLHRVICVYGSRIRQYLDVKPSCPTLVLLPSLEKSFDIHAIKQKLDHIPFVQSIQFAGEHGFIDYYQPAFHQESALAAQRCIKNFL